MQQNEKQARKTDEKHEQSFTLKFFQYFFKKALTTIANGVIIKADNRKGKKKEQKSTLKKNTKKIKKSIDNDCKWCYNKDNNNRKANNVKKRKNIVFSIAIA
ncbi:MAG: hypothetical protein J6T10_24125 [Methanobrevibacter sp.]|nr:hypothetical protein [Methanobrevibacter sp.]